MSSSEKPYVKALDSLRVIAISAVVFVHTTTRTIEATGDNLLSFPLTLFLNQIGRFAVPLFFIVSGFSLELNYDYHTGYLGYIKKRLSRVFIPFVFWSIIYYFFVYTSNNDNFLKVLYWGNASYQLYFIPTLIIFYLVFPLLHGVYNFVANKWVFLGLAGLEVWLLYRDYFIKPFDFPDPIHIALLAYIYFIAGMIAARNKGAIISLVKKIKIPLLLTAVTTGFYVFWEGLIGFLTTQNYLSFYSTWRPSTFIYSMAFALVFFYLFDKSHLQFEIAKKLSNLSFFVFFIHVIVLEGVWSLVGNPLLVSVLDNRIGKVVFDPIFFILVIFFSFLAAFLVHKIPYLRRITG